MAMRRLFPLISLKRPALSFWSWSF